MIIACPACTTKYNLPAESLGSAGRSVRCAKCGHRWHQALSTPDLEEAPQAPQDAAPVDGQTPPPSPEETPTPHGNPQEGVGYEYTPKPHPQVQEPSPAETQEDPFSHTEDDNIEEAPATAVNLPALQEQIQAEKKTAFWQGIGLGVLIGIILLGAGLTLKAPISKALPAVANILHPKDPTAKLHAAAPQGHGLVIDGIQRDILEEEGFTTYIIKGNVANTNLTEASIPDLKVTLLNEKGTILDQWRVQTQKRMLKAGEKTSWVCYFYNPPLDQISEYKVEFVE